MPRSRFLALLHCLALLTARSATAQDPRLARLRTSTAPTSVHMMYMLGREVRNDVGREVFDAQTASMAADATRLPATLESIRTRYEEQKRRNDLGLTIVRGNREIINGAIKLGGVLAPETGGGSLVISGLGYVANKGLEVVEEQFKEAADMSLRRTLQTQLERYQRDAGDPEYRRLLAMNDPAAFRRALELRTGPLLGNALDGVTGPDREVVQAFYDKEIVTLMRDGFSGLSGIQAAQGAELDTLQRNVAGLSRAFVTFADSTRTQLNTLLQTQTEIRADLAGMNARIGNTERGVAFLTQYAFGQMSPAEQLAALRAGVLNVDETTRQEMERQIELVAKREQLNQTIGSYLNGAATLVNIARDLGVDPHLLNTASTAVAVGNAAFSAFQAFSTGNILGGISAVTGLFGGFGGRDVAAERHQEVMGALQNIFLQTQIIQQQLTALAEGQRQIMQNQKAIYDAVLDVSEQIARNHAEVMERLEQIHDDVLFNRQVVLGRVAEEYGRCRRIRYIPETDVPRVSTQFRIYPTYEEFVAFRETYRDPLLSCLQRLQDIENESNDFLVNFYLRAYERPTRADTVSGNPQRMQMAQAAKFIAEIYEPSLELLRISMDTAGYRRALASLFLPVSTVAVLDKKVETVTPVDTLRFGRDTDALMRTLLSPQAVAHHADYLSDYHVYYMLIDPDGRPYSRDQLFAQTSVRQTGYDALRRTRNLLDIAIAQQNLLSGDVLLRTMYQLFARQSKDPTPEEQTAWKATQVLLGKNSILAENFVLYAMRHDVIDNGRQALYHVGLGRRANDDLLRSATRLPWVFRYHATGDTINRADGTRIINQEPGWSAEFAGSFVRLPSVPDLSRGELKVMPDLYELLAQRDRVTDEIASYDVLTGIAPAQRSAVNELLLRSLIPSQN